MAENVWEKEQKIIKLNFRITKNKQSVKRNNEQDNKAKFQDTIE